VWCSAAVWPLGLPVHIGAIHVFVHAQRGSALPAASRP
jgi:hypothetical protein